jgi:L-lactate dehydrogenase complex protein LldG
VERAAMSAARDEILRRIRQALADVPAGESPADVAVQRTYRQRAGTDREELIEQLTETISDYRASVQRIAAGDIAGAVEEACRDRGLRRLVIPPALPDAWRPGGVELIEDRELSAAELDQLDGALTGCATAIAQTGTIVLDGHGFCGRRALTLVPDHHVCVVTEDQVVGLVPEAITRLRPAVAEHRRPLTFISGPSATSDIELTRVEGVHGPRNLLVLIAAQ